MIRIWAVGMLVTALFISQADGGSIWAKRNENAKAIYSDDKARQIGDVLTIVVVEDHKVDNKIDRTLEKTTSHGLTFNGDDNYVEHIFPNMPNMGINASSEKSTEGKSDYKDERTFEDRITVVVEDVYPNGNLLVIGTRTREISGDRQTIQVSGIVRPSDVGYDNTIRSEQVANFQLITMNDGPTADYNEPGWLAKVFDALWPF